ncbi:MAG: hypothetical protein P1V13_22305 [Rhizobiaceae bacterium]|nr:hypothetical protein [Rhizobiaceae bacterium]
MSQENTHPITLIDKIEAFRSRFEPYRDIGFQANAAGVTLLLAELDAIHAQARESMFELSALRWNFEGRADQADELVRAMRANYADPDSNVVLLPTALPRTEAGTA